MVSERARRWACGAALGIALCAQPAFAQPSAADKETARSLMDKGDKAFDSKDYAAALKSYSAAHAIMKVPTTGIEVARAQIALGHLLDGRETALGISRSQPQPHEPKAFAKARTEAGELAQSLVARIPSVEVKVSGPPEGVLLRVVIDGTELPGAASTALRKVDPGEHTIEVSAPGFATATEKVDVKEGENRVVELTLSPETGAGGSASTGTATPANDALVTGDAGAQDEGGGAPALAYIGFGLGVVGIAVGSVTGLMSLSKASAAEDRCVDKRCPVEAQDDIDSSKSMALISNIGFGVGIVGVGVGVVALLSSGGKKETTPPPSARFTPVVGLGYVGVDARF